MCTTHTRTCTHTAHTAGAWSWLAPHTLSPWRRLNPSELWQGSCLKQHGEEAEVLQAQLLASQILFLLEEGKLSLKSSNAGREEVREGTVSLYSTIITQCSLGLEMPILEP